MALASMQPTFFGLVGSPRDAYIILEAARIGILPKVTRRLTDLERIRLVKAGACFVFEERESGIRRWTDQVKWSPSRVSGAFLIYSESSSEPGSARGSVLYKQTFSTSTAMGEKLHLIAYYDRPSLEAGVLPTVQTDRRLASLAIPANVYPDQRAQLLASAAVSASPNASSSVDYPRRTSSSQSDSPSPHSVYAADPRSRASTPVIPVSTPVLESSQMLRRSSSTSAFPNPDRRYSGWTPPGGAFAAQEQPQQQQRQPHPMSAGLPALESLFSSPTSQSPPYFRQSPVFGYNATAYMLEYPMDTSYPSRRHSDQSVGRTDGSFAASQPPRRPRTSEDQRQLDLLGGHLRL